MLVPNRHKDTKEYRYGFQGQEKDDELKGEGNSMNYTFRMHDPRIGRFFATDPLAPKYPFYSPYQFSGNRVIDLVELEGLEPSTPATAEGQRANAIDQTAIDSGDYGPSDLVKMWFDITENNKLYKTWVGHSVTGTSAPVWHEEANYKQIILPIAIDYAKSEGWALATDWKSAKDLIANPGEPNNMVSSETQDFLSSRTMAADFRDYLTQIGASAINSANKNTYSSATGAITPMEFSSPFFGLGLGLKGYFTGSANKFYTVQGVDDATRLLNGGSPFPVGANKSFVGQGVYSFGSKADALTYKSMLEGYGYTDLRIMTFKVANYQKLKVFDMRGMGDDAANAWLETHAWPNNHSYDHIIRPAGNFDEYYFSKSIFNDIKF